MFGYILPEKSHLYIKDYEMYRNFYCGICKSMQRQFGQKERFTVNYDITFLAIVLHNFLGIDVEYEKLHCITQPFKRKRRVVKKNSLTDKLAVVNVALAYYKLEDDMIDSEKFKPKFFRKLFSGSHKKAEKYLNGINEIIETRYYNLRKLEKDNCDGIERVANEFAMMMQEICDLIVGNKTNDNFQKLCYNVGKWIYLIDALDDFTKDKENDNYNPFIINFKEEKTREELVKNHPNEIAFLFSEILNLIAESYKNLHFHFNTDLIDNVVFRGIPLMTKGIIQGATCKIISKGF